MEGIVIPRAVVKAMVKEIAPDGVAVGKKHKLHQRIYTNSGPNFACHIDGHQKLKPWGFPIHGGVDRFSRRMLWLDITHSNNSLHNIASMYLKAVKEMGGCPVEFITNLGTENSIAATSQCFFRENDDSHQYVPSPRDQKIEGWW